MADEREEFKQLNRELRQAQETAKALAPVGWVKEWQACATCGARTKAVKRMSDGPDIPICGECMLREMDEYERHQGERDDR